MSRKHYHTLRKTVQPLFKNGLNSLRETHLNKPTPQLGSVFTANVNSQVPQQHCTKVLQLSSNNKRKSANKRKKKGFSHKFKVTSMKLLQNKYHSVDSTQPGARHS